MITYQVTIYLEAGIEAEWIEWMQAIHIPEVLQTRCFSDCRISKAITADEAEAVYVMQYSCASLEEYERYRDNFAPALQKDHSDRFGGRFRGSRLVLTDFAVIAGADA